MIDGHFNILHTVKLLPGTALLDGMEFYSSHESENFLADIYNYMHVSYPKFFKMDVLCKVGFIAAEILLNAENSERFVPRHDRAVILCNASSSICTDKKFYNDIVSTDEFYPQPSLFVYTLPNIVTGEIAIRNKFSAETSLFLMQNRDDKTISELLERSFLDEELNSAIAGWLDAVSDSNYEAEIFLTEKYI